VARTPRSCPICQAGAEFVAARDGRVSHRRFDLYRCTGCDFVFVADPWTDYETIYNEDYYLGRGADPLVNYLEEILDESSPRHYEWRGILAWARAVTQVDPTTRWLDYGAGSGGLVLYLRRAGLGHAVGYDHSPHAPKVGGYEAMAVGADELEGYRASFDVISAIEVIEHVADPLAELERVARLLAPGGVLLVTTGNAQPYLDKMHTWRYVVPEVHISFFTPTNLARAMEMVGLEVSFPGYVAGWTDIIRYKSLKNLANGPLKAGERLLPWPVITRLLDRHLQLSAQPVGRRPT
jgi:SAM-dependent methyltransferase